LEDPDVDWDNIRMNFREIEWEVVDWLRLAQGPLAGSCEHGKKKKKLRVS
jgi:hypothetical protein